MTPDRHDRVAEVFNAAAELTLAERPPFLQATCGCDPALRAEVESLLAHDDPGSSALVSPILGTGFKITEVCGTDTPPAADLPAFIGPYRILGVLGTGSMGIVYRAQQDSPARTVALKVMHPGRISQSLRRRFQDEIRFLARLRHPGIAHIHDAGTEETSQGIRPYLAMELVDGRPLLDYAAERQLGSHARLELLAKICDAVQHAHQQGVIHRDLKPTNILVEDGDDGPRPRILDFGVARLTDHDVQTATLATEQGQLVGTLAYMSPEQVNADPAEIDTRSDVYALGVIGYELLCATLPIDVRQMSVFAALQAIKESSPAPASAHNRQFRGDLTTILNKALAKDKNRRYESASALANDIRSYLAHRPILAHPPRPLYALGKFIRRNRILTGALMTGGIVALVAVYGLLRADRASREAGAKSAEIRDIAAFLVGDFTTQLNRIAGTSRPRRDLLDFLQVHIESLLVKNPLDPLLLRAQADVVEHLSDLEISEGHYDAAREQRERTQNLRRQVVALEPGNAAYWADLSISLVKVGDVHQQRGENPLAELWWRAALEIDERLVREQPASIHFLDNLAHSYARLGKAAQTYRRESDCERLYQQCEATYARLLELEPNRPLTLYGLWELENNLSNLASDQRKLALALTRAQRALGYTSQLVANAPDNRDYMAAHADAQRVLAGCLGYSGDLAGALRLLGEAQRLAQKSCLTDPQDCLYQRRLSETLHLRGTLLLNAGRLSEGYVVAQAALDSIQRLVNDDPTFNTEQRCRLRISALSDVARAAVALHLPEETERVHIEELELRRQLAERESPEPGDVREYAACLIWSGAPQVSDPQRAISCACRALELSGGSDPKFWQTLAWCYEVSHDPANARLCIERALALVPDDTSMFRTQLCHRLEVLELQLTGD